MGSKDEAVIDARAAYQAFEKLGARPSMQAADHILGSLGKRSNSHKHASGTENLTPTELQVVRLVCKRLSNKEIGKEMRISDRTVGTHLRNIFDKVGVRDRHSLCDWGREQGLDQDQ